MPTILAAFPPAAAAGRSPPGGHARWQLVPAIIALSVADDWQAARREWSLASVRISAAAAACLCGHRPITEVCTLRNRLNGNIAVVGSVCVGRLLLLPADAIFAGLRRIEKDPTGAPGRAAAEHAAVRGWLSSWEIRFLLNTAGKPKRRLSPKQRAVREEINRKMLARARDEGRHDA